MFPLASVNGTCSHLGFNAFPYATSKRSCIAGKLAARIGIVFPDASVNSKIVTGLTGTILETFFFFLLIVSVVDLIKSRNKYPFPDSPRAKTTPLTDTFSWTGTSSSKRARCVRIREIYLRHSRKTTFHQHQDRDSIHSYIDPQQPRSNNTCHHV
jgi:hypothetical protein